MPHNRCVITGIMMCIVLCSTIARAQTKSRKITYNRQAEVTISGIVQQITDHNNGLLGTHLLLQDDGEILDVHLGPSRQLSDLKATLAKGAHVEVVGAMAQNHGRPILLAREVRSGGAVFQLRSPKGLPLRARGGRQ